MEFGVSSSPSLEEELMVHDTTWMTTEDDFLEFSPDSVLTDDSALRIMSANDVQEYFVDNVEELHDNVLDDPETSPYMGFMDKLLSLSYDASLAINQQIHQYTSDFHGSMALRKTFCSMIERKQWYYIPTNTLPSAEHINAAKSIVNEFHSCVEKHLNSNSSIGMPLPDRDSLQRWLQHCKINYFSRPIEFIEVMQKMLDKEKSIILNWQTEQKQLRKSQVSSPGAFSVTSSNEQQSPRQQQQQQQQQSPQQAQMSSGTAFILNEVSLADSILMEMRVNYEEISNQYHRLQSLMQGKIPYIDPACLERLDPEQKEMWMKVYHEIGTCRRKKSDLLERHVNVLVEKVKMVTSSLYQQISLYRDNMAKKMIGDCLCDAPEIDRLQDCCKLLGQVIQGAMDHVDRLLKLRFAQVSGDDEKRACEIMRFYQQAFKTMVKKCIVIDKHPCQVVMKEKKFIVELRHLMGTALPQTQFDTTVVLISSTTYSKLKQDQPTDIRKVGQIKVKNSSSGEGRTRSTTNSDTGQVAVKFNNMSISIAPRGGDKTKSETVAEEKLTMLFTSTLPVSFCNGDSATITCQTFSLPLVVTTHGKQEADANATIFWDNAFSMPHRKGFEVFESVPWSNLLYYLDLFWRRHCESETGYDVNKEGRGLDGNARQFLANTFFGSNLQQGQNPTVSWKQVSRNQLAKREFSFWTWFYKIVELVSSPYVKKFWRKGFVVGFISRQNCESMLSQRPFGTFMLRFSESLLGSLVITVYTHNKQGMGNVINLEPDNIHSFRFKRSLPGNMKDLRQLKILYPDVMKDDAFREYWEPENKMLEQLISPYVQKVVKVTIDD